MKLSLTEIPKLCSELFGYVFWIGGTLWIWKRSMEIHQEAGREPAEALRVPSRVAWLLTGKKDITAVSLGGMVGPFFALFWFTLIAMVGGYIHNIWVYYVFWFSVVIIAIWAVVFFVHHLAWWWKRR